MKKILSVLIITVVLCSALAFSSAAADYYVYDATDISGTISAQGGLIASNDYVIANNTLYTTVTATTDGIGGDSTQIDIKIADIAHDFNIKDYPIMKLRYRSDINAADAYIDFNIGVNYGGKQTRIWGITSGYAKTGEDSALTVDLKAKASGGEGISGYSWENIDDDSGVNYVRIKPYFSNKAIVKGEYFDIEYIAFFKDLTTAEKFDYNYDFDAAAYSDVYLTEQVRRAVVGDTLNMNIAYLPTFKNKPTGVSYSTSNESIATVDSTGAVTCHAAGEVTITAVYEDFTSTCKIFVLAEKVKAVDFVTRVDGQTATEVKTSHLGDSITTYSPNPKGGNNYHDWWGRWFCVDNEDKGISGSSFTAVGQDPFVSGRVDRVTETTIGTVQPMRADADLVTVKGGTNDSGSARIGDINERSTSTYVGAARYLMESLITRYPDKQIVFFTPIHRSRTDNSVEHYNKYGESLADISAAMIAVGEIYNIPVIDIYNPEQLNFASTIITPAGFDENGKWVDAVCESDLMPDGLHPSGKGHIILAEYMISEMIDRGIINATKLGDLNADNTIDMIDLIALSRHCANWNGYDSAKYEVGRADFDHDGEVGALDVAILARHLANWSEYDMLTKLD